MKFSHSFLDNGFNVVTDYVPDAKMASVHWAVRAGARHGAPGVAHFYEHMFTSSLTGPNGAEIWPRLLDISVNDCNFATSHSATTGYADVLPRFVPEVMQTFGRAVRDPVWNDALLERERTTIDNEFKKGSLHAPEALRNAMFASFYSGQTLAQKILGEREDIARIQNEDLRDYRRQHFLAGDMALVVSGPMSHEEILKLAQAHFGGIAAGKNKELPAVLAPRSIQNLCLEVPEEKFQTIMLASPSVVRSSEHFVSMVDVVAMLKQRLNEFLRNNGYSYEGLYGNGMCFAASLSDHAQNVICYRNEEPARTAEGLRQVAEFIATPELWMTENHFELRKLSDEVGTATYFLNPGSRASMIAHEYTVMGKIQSYEDISVKLSCSDYASLLRAHDIFKNSGFSVLGYGPCTELPSAQEINAIIQGKQAAPAVPTPRRDFDLV